jgi:mannose-6-phosphate isomerase-like protein (cupin superfamily)
MPTLTPTPDEMASRIVRFDTIQPKKSRLEAAEGIPAKALEAIAANSIYLYMAPGTAPGAGNQNPGIKSLDGLTVNICRCPPGDGPALHAHDRTVETFMTLRGEFEVSWGDTGEHLTALKQFDMISVPPRVMRSFRNIGTEEAILLVLIQGETRDVATDVQYAPETGRRIADEFGEDVRTRIEQMGWRFDAELSNQRC